MLLIRKELKLGVELSPCALTGNLGVPHGVLNILLKAWSCLRSILKSHLETRLESVILSEKQYETLHF